jgi:hypothetical protein
LYVVYYVIFMSNISTVNYGLCQQSGHLQPFQFLPRIFLSIQQFLRFPKLWNYVGLPGRRRSPIRLHAVRAVCIDVLWRVMGYTPLIRRVLVRMIRFISSWVTHFIWVILKYRQYSGFADLHTLQHTVARALGLPVSTSRLLATDYNSFIKSHTPSIKHVCGATLTVRKTPLSSTVA